MTQTTAARPSLNDMNGKTHEGRQRQLIHALARVLGYSEHEYRLKLSKAVGKSHAGDCDRRELAVALDVFNEYVDDRTDPATGKLRVYPRPGTAEYLANASDLEDLLAVA